MDHIDLIELVRPEGGWYGFLAVKNKTTVRQLLVETRKELDKKIQEYVDDRWCVFFGLGKYKDGTSRTQNNVESLKSFWVDIDCGEGKSNPHEKTGRPEGYETQAKALQALVSFCKKVNLPRPLIVNSGNGVHAYWPLQEEVRKEEWEPVARRLRTLCVDNDFYVDTKVFEAARVLRPLGTYNFKGDAEGVPEKPVCVIGPVIPAMAFESFRDLLGAPQYTEEVKAPKRELSALGKALRDKYSTLFSQIIVRSAKGEGCAQILDCYQNRATLSEPRWFNVLSIASKCDDAEKAIQKVSEGHPDYDPIKVINKAKGIKAPHTCLQFEQTNPGLCAGCPHKARGMKSPIQLGSVIKKSKAQEVVAPAATPEAEDIILKIPKLPNPYFRGDNGGIFKEIRLPPKSEDGEETIKNILVYEHDLFVWKRMNDPNDGDAIVLNLRLPMDGLRQFTVTNTQLTDQTDLRKRLASHGVVVSSKLFPEVQEYLLTAVRNLQYKKRVELMRLQFGWVDNDSKFILGDREITADGTYHSPPSSTTMDIAKHVHAAGSFEKWKQVFNLYGEEGHEPHAFAAFTAFGAPLLKFMGQNGGIINVIHPDSGTGKTTVLHMCNSVYGNPEGLCAVFADTLNAKLMRLGIMNNLPFTIDEITNLTAKEFSTLAYSMSQGRGKDRLKASSNELRLNLTTWATMSLASSNASFYEKMTADKLSPEGELMRVIEYKIAGTSSIPTDYGKEMFDHQLQKNYGHAGEIYLEYLVKNLEEVVKMALQLQAKLDKNLKLSQRERFWSAFIAANLAGASVAKRLNLHDIDIRKVYGWIPAMVAGLREEVALPVTSASSVVGDYINRHIQNILVIEDAIDKRNSKAKQPDVEPRSSLLIRYEPDTQLMFLAAKAFKDDCVSLQINYKSTINNLTLNGIYKGTKNKRLSKGMEVVSPAVHCIVLDCSNSEFVNMDAFVHAASDAGTDDSRED